jgi:hypothetical protein
MIKNLTSNQILLIAMGTVLFLLSAFSFYLLQDPTAPLPFAPPPSSITPTSIPPSPTNTPAPSSTSLPTRQTSYTPFASPGTPASETPPGVTDTPETATAVPIGTSSPGIPTNTSTLQPGLTSTVTHTPIPATITAIPTTSPTLMAGEHGVTGQVLQNSTPVANVKVSFSDDNPPRQGVTDQGGHYWFITLAPGTNFILQFSRVDNPQLTPAQQIAPLAWIEGNLPTGDEIITITDLEVSLNLEGVLFESQTPVDGTTYSATYINSNNPLQFNWTLYSQGEYYFIELGASGSDEPIWISDDTDLTSLMWDGTLDNGNHVSEGTYWWRVGVRKSLEYLKLIVFTADKDLLFNP